MDSSPLLRLVAIEKAFGAVRALRGVSLDVSSGEVHALLGENGAGKTTLIKVLTGAHRADAGRVEIDGKWIEHLTPATARELGIACVYQQAALFPDLTVAENLRLRLEKADALQLVRWAEWRARARELLRRIGADISPDSEVRDLSMPEQQLVEIACAIGAEPRVVIMDEPTASLTQREQEWLYAIVRDLRAHGVGVIYISHRLEEIFALADRVTVLRDGASVATLAVGETTEAALIHMMVGRDVEVLGAPPSGEPGATVLALRALGCAATGVHDITVDVHAGEIVGFAGLVGAGRTELTRVLFGLTPADTGTIVIHDREVSIASPRVALEQGIAYVPEDRRRHGVILEMPMAANVSMSVHDRLFPAGWMRFGQERQLARRFIGALDVRTSSEDAAALSLSGGNQQKVAIARWLATDPRILILDEPTQGVDIGAKTEIHKIIRRLADDGMAVLLISSDLPEIIAMSNRIAVMCHGTIAAMLGENARAEEIMAAALAGRREAA